MKVVQCPAVYTKPRLKSLFLAGGISNCPEWQDEFIGIMSELSGIPYDFTLINPRREDFDVANPRQSSDQIAWEYAHLQDADAISFWFPKETLCPITLFELGSAIRNPYKPIFVGCHPEYARRFDVEHQLSIVRPEVVVVDSLELLALEIKKELAHG
jgi:hypothetical protein